MRRFTLPVVMALAVTARTRGTAAPDDKVIAALQKKLAVKVSIDRPIKNHPLPKVLEYLHHRFKISIRVDTKAFRRKKVANIGGLVVALPAQDNVPLGIILRRILKPLKATYCLEKGFIVIIPQKAK